MILLYLLAACLITLVLLFIAAWWSQHGHTVADQWESHDDE